MLIRILRDPFFTMTVYGNALTIPLSQPLPPYSQMAPQFDRLSVKTVEYIRRKTPIVSVDVGAEMGDTVAAFNPVADDNVHQLFGDEVYDYQLAHKS
jgi:hypothetical protein